MKPRSYSTVAAASLLALWGMSLNANAITVVTFTDTQTLPLATNALPTTTTGVYNADLTASVHNSVLSPWAGTPDNGSLYNALSMGSAGPGTATYDFTSTTKVFNILWGSPDFYNSIEFFNGATLLGSYTGTSFQPPNDTGHQYITFTSTENLTSVELLNSGQAAFEWSAVTSSSGGNIGTPLPAALPLFAGGLGLVGLFARKRRKAQIAP